MKDSGSKLPTKNLVRSRCGGMFQRRTFYICARPCPAVSSLGFLANALAELFPDHYAALGLDRRCTLSQIRDAYRSLASKFHPDRNRNSSAALRKMQQVNEAYEVLSDPVRR